MQQFDVLVIGSGSAGTAAALGCARGGLRTAIAESRAWGGTCVLRGCDPKKVFVEAARAVDAVRRYRELGVITAPPALNWAALQRFKRQFTDPVPAQRERELREAGVTTIFGTARITGERRVEIDGEAIEARHVIVATGAHARHVAAGDDLLMTSDDLLDLEALPPSMLFIGGGYIALEFAHVAARFGSDVTILTDGPEILHGFDPQLARTLREISQARGIRIECNVKVQRVTRTADGVEIDGRRAAAGVLAAGRIATVDALGLESIGVTHSDRGIPVDATTRSRTCDWLYAVGDCADAGEKALTPVASTEGELAAHNIVNGTQERLDLRGLASIVYTIPSLATVGDDEQRARQYGEIEIHEGDMNDWFSTRSTASDRAAYRIFTDRASRRLLGGSILGPHADEQINVLAAALRAGITIDALAQTPFGYPTGSSDLGYITGAW